MSAFINLFDFELGTIYVYLELEFDLENEQNIFLSYIYNVFTIKSCILKLCSHQCECMGTKNSSITEEWVFRNLCNRPSVLFRK